MSNDALNTYTRETNIPASMIIWFVWAKAMMRSILPPADPGLRCKKLPRVKKISIREFKVQKQSNSLITSGQFRMQY